MVRLYGVDDLGAFLVFLGQLHTNGHMAALYLVGQGLANIMQQTGTPCQGGVQSQLGRHAARQLRHLYGVLQHILAVAGAVAHPAQQLHQLGMQVVYAGLNNCPFAVLLDFSFHLTAGLLHGFLYAGRVDASILDELLQRKPRHLTLHGIVAGKGDRLGGIIYDEIHTGQILQRADVASLTADDTALHFIIGQRHHRNGDLCHMVAGAALNGGGKDLAGLFVALLLQLLLVLGDLQRLFVGQLVLQHLQHVVLRLLLAKARNLLQHLKLALLDLLDLLQAFIGFRLTALHGLFLFLQVIDLLIEVFFLLLQAVFLPLHLAAPLLHFTVGFAFHAIDLVFCLYQCLFFLALGGLNGVTDQTLGFLLGGTKLCFSNLHSILNAQKKGDDSGNQYESYRCDYHKPQFHLYHWSGSILSYECIVKVPPLRGRG